MALGPQAFLGGRGKHTEQVMMPGGFEKLTQNTWLSPLHILFRYVVLPVFKNVLYIYGNVSVRLLK